ncbi:MAG TPA: SAM-dependent methyltransferase, partial [Kofleriaceae bacterium]|nr:SAM-dependent methyltransferase [Kofleriaceae bacterium]
MRDDTPSRTAAWVAAARQLGRLLPEDVRIADDPYGAAFTSIPLARAIELAVGGGLGALPARFATLPGIARWITYMQVRTRVIDDIARAFPGRQLVLLGAGYDCRALRLELPGARVFEVDHPATQGHKRRVLEKLGATSSATYVTWDFETNAMDDLPAALADAGHDASIPTLTIWEGVTMYLTEAAIDASLRAIAQWSAQTSQLAMTYFAKSRLASPSWTMRAIAGVVSRLGEPWRFGWDPAELPDFLEARGLALLDDIALSDAARTLLPTHLARTIDDPG